MYMCERHSTAWQNRQQPASCSCASLPEQACELCNGGAGVSEGRPRNVVLGSRQEGPDRWFSTSESAHPAPWVELHLPHNVRLLSLQHYTFTHGHHRSSYFRWASNTLPHSHTNLLLVNSFIPDYSPFL